MNATIPDSACPALTLDDLRCLLAELSEDCPALHDVLCVEDDGTIALVDTIHALVHAYQDHATVAHAAGIGGDE